MLRKLRRSVARHNMEQQDIHIFGKYSLKTMKVPNRNGNLEEQDVMKSYFSLNWRAWS